MALYPLEEFKSLVKADNWMYFNTKLPFNTLDNLEWEDSDFLNVLYGLTDYDFQRTVNNCKIENYPYADVVVADQYEIYWDTENLVRLGHKLISSTTVILSLKIAIISNEHGRMSGVVTVHPSGSSWRG